MLAFACLFTVLALFGSLVGAGTVGNPIGTHHLTSYGWALCINAAALSALLMFKVYERHRSRPH
ncbi:hypothetical protein [Methylobacterium sp. J-070]|uniref:hypothetical protein n=1 Tax=Methylobacterium sp. J-070 TaxID=2836650 RepID=UPI001FB9E5AA|nr:hypothetical protein [Methylobacterium sp. J-070]MCJ2052343.1 hypothetical protein [Methylobacterium sp. J-070]